VGVAAVGGGPKDQVVVSAFAVVADAPFSFVGYSSFLAAALDAVLDAARLGAT
jgi:hypothetical protein